MALQVNISEVVEQVRVAFAEYDRALIENDVKVMNALFWDAPETVRYGVADIQYGGEALYKWRASARPVTPPRERQHTIITTFGSDFATVSTEFTNDADTSLHGRQMQTWARVGSISDVYHGWRIVAAHVSLV